MIHASLWKVIFLVENAISKCLYINVLTELPSSFRDQFPAESESASARRQWLNAIIDEYMTQFVFDGTVNRDLVVVADEVDRLHSNEINGYRCRAPGCEMTYKSHAWRVR